MVLYVASDGSLEMLLSITGVGDIMDDSQQGPTSHGTPDWRSLRIFVRGRSVGEQCVALSVMSLSL